MRIRDGLHRLGNGTVKGHRIADGTDGSDGTEVTIIAPGSRATGPTVAIERVRTRGTAPAA
jgi:hypothetical protein